MSADAELDLAFADRPIPDCAGAAGAPSAYLQGIFDREMGVTLSNLKAGSPRDEAMRRLTEEAANLYAKRVLRELIQNAFDGAAGGDARILIRLDLSQGNGVLHIANAGRGFTQDNVDAVVSPAMSNKTPGNFIGHKGLGFRSVELLSDAVEIHSVAGAGRPGTASFDGFCFRFADASDERAWLDARGELEHAERVVGRVHRLQLPIPIVESDSDDATLPVEARLGPHWRAALRTGSPWSGIRYQSRNYTTRETLFVIPGQAEHATMPDAAKLAYARMLVALISGISPALLQTTLSRVGGNGDSVTWPSPASAFLTHGEWLPVGSDDELSWRRPSDCWYAPRGEQLPRFVQRILRWARDGLDASKGAREFVTGKLGLLLWNDPSSAPARLAHLGAALVEGIAEPDHDAFRKAHREAWDDWRGLTPRPPLPQRLTLALQGSGRPAPLPAGATGLPATVYVGDGSDAAREQLVSALGHNLLAVPAGVAPDAAAALRKVREDVFTLLPEARLTITADGAAVEPRGDAPALVEAGCEWLAEIAVLVLEFNDTLSSRNTVRSRRALYDSFMRLRMVFAREVAVELDGRTGPLRDQLEFVCDRVERSVLGDLRIEVLVDDPYSFCSDSAGALLTHRLEPISPLDLLHCAEQARFGRAGRLQRLPDLALSDHIPQIGRNDHPEPKVFGIRSLQRGDRALAHVDHLNGPPNLA